MLLKDDSGSYAVFTEQGSFASQLTAAKVMDVVDKQQTHPDIWIRLQKPKMAQTHGPAWKTQSFLLSEICTVILLAGLS